MRKRETYFTYNGPPAPELRDLPSGTFAGDERDFDSLSPGSRRAIWRDAVLRQARSLGLPIETIERLKVATISGGLATLDEYLMALDLEDARRSAAGEDWERLRRAEEMHAKAAVQIAAREAL